MRDCDMLRAAGFTKSGIYKIDPDDKGEFAVFCEMKRNGSGTVYFVK